MPTPSALEQAHDLLVDTRATLDVLLQSQDMTRIMVKTKMDQMVNNLAFILGKQQAPNVAPRQVLTKLTEFMGEKLERPKRVTVEELTPDQLKAKIFAEKVDKLTGQFEAMENEQIIDAYKADPVVIRGVAKRAGLEKYNAVDVPKITADFLNEIRTALSAQRDFNQNKLKIEKDLENQAQQ